MGDTNDALIEGMGALQRFVVGNESLPDTLERVAYLVEDVVSTAKLTGITLIGDDGRPTTAARTDAETQEIDSAQYEADEGPCLHAFRTRRVVHVRSIRNDARWRNFRSSALEHGVHSSLSIPLEVDDSAIGALNLYGSAENGFSADDERNATLFAAQASIALQNAQAYWGAYQEALNLGEAMKSRALIEQAKGILIGETGVSAEEAFDMLRRASQRENRKLRDIASEIVERAQRRRNPRDKSTD